MTAHPETPGPGTEIPQPVRKSVEVPLSPEAAFDLFTAGLDTWWPSESHSLSAADGDLPRSVEVEPRVGGQIIETKPDGSRVPWGRVTRWEPGRAFGVAWHVGRGEEEATDLEVVFTAVAEATRVDLTHSGFERLAGQAVAMSANYNSGWDLVLGARFTAAATALVPG